MVLAVKTGRGVRVDGSVESAARSGFWATYTGGSSLSMESTRASIPAHVRRAGVNDLICETTVDNINGPFAR